MTFTWDSNKNLSNIKKHGISFSEAITTITDPLSIHLYDEAHSISEDRWLAIGNTDGRVLVVSFTMQGDDYRIISARKATKVEEELYFGTIK